MVMVAKRIKHENTRRNAEEMERCKMAGKQSIVIERLEGKGVMAKVITGGAQYDTYKTFAELAGYPDAAKRAYAREEVVSAYGVEGEIVSVLAKGSHEAGFDTIYVCETDKGERFLIGERGIEIIEIPTLKSATFEELLDELMERIKGGEGEMPRTEPMRADIVAQAKADIEGLKRTENFYMLKRMEILVSVDFVVNADKRTVVALLRGAGSGVIRGRGIAKCDPSDCFNEHIGKAIALRRALGLDVPTEYLNAPQPEGVQVGDVVLFDDDLVPHRVDHDHAILVIRPIPNIHLSCALEYGNTVINDSARY